VVRDPKIAGRTLAAEMQPYGQPESMELQGMNGNSLCQLTKCQAHPGEYIHCGGKDSMLPIQLHFPGHVKQGSILEQLAGPYRFIELMLKAELPFSPKR
jgi:hypothetical protein